MKIEKVAVAIRYSKQLPDGSHKTVELSAEATPDARESWQTAQGALYAELGQQLRQMWAGNGHVLVEVALPPAAAEPEPPAHYCQEHKLAFKRIEKNGQVWFSHKEGSGWCREAT